MRLQDFNKSEKYTRPGKSSHFCIQWKQDNWTDDVDETYAFTYDDAVADDWEIYNDGYLKLYACICCDTVSRFNAPVCPACGEFEPIKTTIRVKGEIID